MTTKTSDPPPLLVVLAGPTGVGKTSLALSLAERLGSPIINADSRQLYRDIPIGTAAPTQQELQRVRHYFVGTLPLEAETTAATYEAEVLALLEELFQSHSRLILSGGSLMYIDAVCHGIDPMPSVPRSVREELNRHLAEEGLEALATELSRLDPDYAAVCDLRNPRRVIHALEICRVTSLPYSSFRRGQAHTRPFRILKIALNRPRSELYERIDKRVEQMVANGLVEEARRVYPCRALNSLNTVGYKELFDYFDGLCPLNEAIAKIQQHSRNFAKRQLTWLRRDVTLHWFHPDQLDAILNLIDL